MDGAVEATRFLEREKLKLSGAELQNFMKTVIRFSGKY